jgi:phosphatidylserine/phosphatidylglycerophosphate/cardiolipin synthase-like enzyme
LERIMPIRLLYHDRRCPGAVSPFDEALLRIARAGNVRLACPYIGLGYLDRVVGQTPSWLLLTDVEEWLRSQNRIQRKKVYQFLVRNRDRIRHYPRLHAKVAIGTRFALLGSANFTNAGIQRRTELSALFEEEPQVQELTEWFDQQWEDAYELNEVLLHRIAAFMRKLPERPVVEKTRKPVISPLLTKPAPLEGV